MLCLMYDLYVLDIGWDDVYRLVCSMKPHVQKVVGVDFQPGMDFSKVQILALKGFNHQYPMDENAEMLNLL